MKVAIDRQAGEQIAGVNAGAGQAIGGYQRGAAQARGGVDQNYRLELGANKQIYVTQVDAAGQIRGAGLDAAKLRQAAAVPISAGLRGEGVWVFSFSMACLKHWPASSFSRLSEWARACNEADD
jgi:hypothetical protein